MIHEIINHLWQSTIFGGAIALLILAFRRSTPDVRYVLWLIASVKFLVPFSLLLALGSQFGREAAVSPIARPVSRAIIAISEPFPAGASGVPSFQQMGGSLPVNWLPFAVVCLWALGFAGVSFLRFRAWLRVRAAMRSSIRVNAEAAAEVRVSTELFEPGVVGYLRPVILLPKMMMSSLTGSEMKAVLAHELCHVRRLDNLTAAIHMTTEAIFWFHPLVWWIGARLIEERELACDEAVLRVGIEPRSYAEVIVKICKLYVESPLACISGMAGADLRKRIHAILRNRIGAKLNLGRKLLLASAGLVAIGGPFVIGMMDLSVSLRAQSSRALEPVQGDRQEFDVASVKPNKSDSPPSSNFPLNAGGMYTVNGGLLSATNFPLVTYIFFAYNLMGNQAHFLVPQLPSWVTTDRFDIQARAAGNPTKDQMRIMMQSLLADRFKLAIHTERREVPVLAFVLAKPGKTGAQLQPHPADAPCETSVPPASAANPVPDIFSQKVPGGFPAICNSILGIPPSVAGRSRLGGRNITLGFMADMFSQRVDLGRPMIDATGLTGTFDFLVEFTPESKGRTASDANLASDPDGPTFEQALRDQLGLKLESRRSSMNVMILDHLERPSEN